MTFLPADSEGGQNFYLWHFLGIILGLLVGIFLAFGIGHDMLLGFLHFFGIFCFFAFFCQVELLNFPMFCPHVFFSHLLPHHHCIFNPFPLMPYGHMAMAFHCVCVCDCMASMHSTNCAAASLATLIMALASCGAFRDV